MPETPYNFVNDKRLDDLKKWLSDSQITFDHLTIASADAGFRRYFRLHKDKNTKIAVDAPPQFEDTSAFLNIAERLSHSGLHPPKVFCYSLEKGFLVVEDLGQQHFQHALEDIQITGSVNEMAKADRAQQMYKNAMQTIIDMQHLTSAENLPAYDAEFIRTELNLFPSWYLQKHLNYSISSAQQAVIDDTFALLIETAEQQPQNFMHRDFHCRNLMLTDDNKIGIIDFQGAMNGPVTYDPVSLLKDVYLEWPASFQQPLIEQHRNSLAVPVDKKTYQRWFDYMGLQRHLKILGIFSRLKYRDNKPGYMNNIDVVRRHIETTTADYPELSTFASLFKQIHTDTQPT